MPLQIQNADGTPSDLDNTAIGNTIKTWWNGVEIDLAPRGYPGLKLVDAPPVVTPPTLEQAKQAKLAELAALRYQRETAGINGFRTDRESQGLLTGAALAATLDANYTVDWKADTGWVTLNATQLLGAAQIVRAHVQACFSNERAHAEAIGDLTTVEAVQSYNLATGWP